MAYKLIGAADATAADNLGANYICIDRFQCSVSGLCSEIRIKVSTSLHAKVAIYADNSGAPGDRLAKQDTGQACTAGWNTISLESAVELASGTYYWLAFILDTTSVTLYYTGSGTHKYKAQTYAGFTWPDTISGLSDYNFGYSLIAGWGNNNYSLTATDGFKNGDTPGPKCSFQVSCTDGLKGGDVSPNNVNFADTVATDGVTFGDMSSIGFLCSLALTDGVKFGDAIERLVGWNPTVTDGVSLGESLATQLASYPVLTEGIMIGEIPGTLLEAVQSVTDGLVLADMPVGVCNTYLTAADGLKLGDTIAYQIITNLVATDGLKMSDATILYLAAIGRVLLLVKYKTQLNLDIGSKAKLFITLRGGAE